MKSLATMDQYQEMYERVGKRMLVSFPLAGISRDLLLAMITNIALGKQIMDFAVAYGHVCFTEGLELGKEEKDV